LPQFFPEGLAGVRLFANFDCRFAELGPLVQLPIVALLQIDGSFCGHAAITKVRLHLAIAMIVNPISLEWKAGPLPIPVM
jgi:hypothetical protein